MNTVFSGATPSSGISCWTASRMPESPQPGHQRTSWSLVQSFFVVSGTAVSVIARAPSTFRAASGRLPSSQARRARSSRQLLLDGVLELPGGERQALDLREGLGVDQVLGPDDAGQLAAVELGDQ